MLATACGMASTPEPLAVELKELSSPEAIFDEYRGGSSAGWIAHRFKLELTYVWSVVESKLREQLEQLLVTARTSPCRVHVSIVTAPLSRKG